MKNSDKIEEFLDLLHHADKVFWTIGYDGATIQIFNELLDDKTELFDLSFYADQENDPTVQYLKKNSINDILAGRNPDMIPEKVCITEGGNGIVEIHFRRSKKLQDAGVDGIFYLNRDLEDTWFGVIVNGFRSEKYIVGYSSTEKQEPFIKTYYENGVTSLATFTIVSKY